jgi:glutamyl-tRNA(Gln) amidotransferase subunit E
MGDVDRAAKYEYLKDKDFIYNIYDDVSCLVELDEEPPHPVNPEALDVAMEAALLMNCDIPDEIHFMRKLVIDGSNTAGFQRTAIVGLNGTLETSEGAVAIEDMELEEESAGIHTREKGRGVFDLDRLGIPLIEIGTDAAIQSPAHAQEVAKKIGMLLRSTGKVKRGLGTIRQDVNVSIADGARVEIKGFQEIEELDALVANEVERQVSLLDIRDELQDRVDDDISGEIADVTDIFAESDNEIIGRIIESDGVVLAVTLHGLEGLMNETLAGDLHLGKELAQYATAQGANGIMHTDEDLARYGLEDEFAAVCDEIEKEDGDVVVIVAEQEETAQNAAEIVAERAEALPSHIPEETRTAAMDQTTRYARPLPGSARMYPETDIPPITIDTDYINQIESDLPATLEEQEEQLAQVIGDELASQVVHSKQLQIFTTVLDQLADAVDRAAVLDDVGKPLANAVTNIRAQLADDDVPVDRLRPEHYAAIFAAYQDDEIAKSDIADGMAAVAEQPDAAVDAVIEEAVSQKAGEDEIRNVVQDVISEKEAMIAEQGEHARGALMGLVMQRLDNADGSTVNRILSEELEKKL